MRQVSSFSQSKPQRVFVKIERLKANGKHWSFPSLPKKNPITRKKVTPSKRSAAYFIC